MITVLGGGTATLNLIRGLRTFLNDPELCVVANTSDALWVSQSSMLRDLDAAMYLFCGILNPALGHGIKGDTYATHKYFSKIGRVEPFQIGDKERAVMIARAEMLGSGIGLTEVTEALSSRLGVAARILPMTDDEVAAYVDTACGRLHVLEYHSLAEECGEVTATGLEFREQPMATAEVRSAIEQSDAVIIGPADPLTTITPILSCEGVSESLRETFVIALSPFTGGSAPGKAASALLGAQGIEATSKGVYGLYAGVFDLFVQDARDPCWVEDTLRLETSLRTRAGSESLAWDLMAMIRRRDGRKKNYKEKRD
jgi:LPPG:FO 2-phospho-L-lactate transferase